MTKRTLDSFFTPPSKKVKDRSSEAQPSALAPPGEAPADLSSLSQHITYPFSVPVLPPEIIDTLLYSPATDARHIHDRPHLDLLYYEPFINRKHAKNLFHFLRRELFFYRVQYKIKRGPVETQINTPRYTTVFGVDDSSRWKFDEACEELRLVESSTNRPIDPKKYSCQPRPIPECLESLRRATEAVTGETFNFCLVNYYADGQDSISYHSDDERFLGKDPAIASFSLGDKRDFLMKPKPSPSEASVTTQNGVSSKPVKLSLASGDMVLMRKQTQANWLHSIPKRKGGQGDGGRINITFRRALVKGGTENYYQYNVGVGEAHKWDETGRKMVPLIADVT